MWSRIKDCKTGDQFWTEVNRYHARKKAKSNDIGHEQWNEHFCALLAGSEEIVDTPVDQGLLTLILKGDDRLDQCFTLEEFKKTLSKLKRGKAPGKDGILNEFWQSLSLRSMLLLLDVINRIWLAETWPDSWRDGLITPIYKTGDASLANNYRGITLLNTLYKIVTSMMAKRISNWLFLEDKLSENQAGFRRKYSVRQGCPLSPCLFSIFINDMEDGWEARNIGGTGIGLFKIFCLKFANDVAIVAESRKGLQEMIDCLVKSEGRKRKDEKWTYDGAELTTVSAYKYLGFTFTAFNVMTQHMDDVRWPKICLRAMLKEEVQISNWRGDLDRIAKEAVTPHATMNSSKGVIFCSNLVSLSEESLTSLLADQGVSGVRTTVFWSMVCLSDAVCPTNVCPTPFVRRRLSDERLSDAVCSTPFVRMVVCPKIFGQTTIRTNGFILAKGEDDSLACKTRKREKKTDPGEPEPDELEEL
uniref:Reverse transcriptase domain-containing protein n=1 Tax=Strigamia maritima TaxID=126957 RepID=T1IJU1_STRMM